MMKLLRCDIGVVDKEGMPRHFQGYEKLNEIFILHKCLIILRLSVGESATENISPSNYVEMEADILHSSKPMFCCTTSGTTGIPKMVQVPFKCLMPNVISLRYKLAVYSIISDTNSTKYIFVHTQQTL